MGMLALTRRKGEEVVIGDPLNPLGVVRVVDIHGDKVKLAFDFPRDCPINRRELADEKRREAEAGSGLKQAEDKPSSGTSSEKKVV